MKAYGKSWDYNVYDCQYCLYWKGKKKGCTYPDGCCCPVEQKPAKRNGIEQVYDKGTDSEETALVSESARRKIAMAHRAATDEICVSGGMGKSPSSGRRRILQSSACCLLAPKDLACYLNSIRT